MSTPAKKLLEMGAEAATKGKKALSEFEKLLAKEPQKTQSEFDRLLEKEFRPKSEMSDFERLLKKDLPAKVAPKPVAKPTPGRTPRTGPLFKVPPRPGTKRKYDDGGEKGLVKISDAVSIARAVLEPPEGTAIAAFEALPFIGALIEGVKAILDDSDTEKIRKLLVAARLDWKKPRVREGLEVPKKYPNGQPKIDIMRRAGSFMDRVLDKVAPVKEKMPGPANPTNHKIC